MARPQIVNGVPLVIVKDYDELSRAAATHVISRVRENPQLSLLVPTGTTPEGLYKLLIEQPSELSSNVSFYNMDEYCERLDAGEYAFLSSSDDRSYHHYVKQHLLGAFPRAKSFFPGIANIQRPGSYDELVASNGGFDLCINAIGEDGHTFGFNIPGSSFDSQTRLIALNDDTKTVNEKLTGLVTPQLAVTVGLDTGMKAREVLLLVSGERKAKILKRVLTGAIAEDVPATILTRHKN
jgi:glucosamine-6-phosphate deaminase